LRQSTSSASVQSSLYHPDDVMADITVGALALLKPMRAAALAAESIHACAPSKPQNDEWYGPCAAKIRCRERDETLLLPDAR
jgi:hypothetical protein